jgi:hypothetical protein
MAALAVTGVPQAEVTCVSPALGRRGREAALALRLVQTAQDLQSRQAEVAALLAAPSPMVATPDELSWPEP